MLASKVSIVELQIYDDVPYFSVVEVKKLFCVYL